MKRKNHQSSLFFSLPLFISFCISVLIGGCFMHPLNRDWNPTIKAWLHCDKNSQPQSKSTIKIEIRDQIYDACHARLGYWVVPYFGHMLSTQAQHEHSPSWTRPLTIPELLTHKSSLADLGRLDRLTPLTMDMRVTWIFHIKSEVSRYRMRYCLFRNIWVSMR